MIQNNKIQDLDQIGHDLLNKYELAGGLIDIFCGVTIISLCTCLIAFGRGMGIWLLIWLLAWFGLTSLLIYLRDKMITPRIGKADFTTHIKSTNRNLMTYLGYLLVLPAYMFLVSTLTVTWASAFYVMFALNFVLIPFYAAKVKYYFILAYALIPLVYPFYRGNYKEILLFSAIMVVYSFLNNKFRRIRKPSWDFPIIPKPKNVLQMILMLVIALIFNYIMFTLFRHDVATFVKNPVSQNTEMTISIVSALFLITLGIGYKSKRMYFYAVLVAILTSITNLIRSINLIPYLSLLIAGSVILISGIRLFVLFIHENPIIKVEETNETK